MWADIVAIYRASKKKQDVNWFTEHVARPPASVVVYALRRTRVTPNQVTFASAVLAAAAALVMALVPGHAWLIAAAGLYELSYVLNCADGQLARLRKTPSPVGHLLDFLMDELKAMFLLGCVTARLWQETGHDWLLLVGLGALFCLASGISLTSFTRRPEYAAATGRAVDAAPVVEVDDAPVRRRRGPVGLVVSGLELAARFVVHYPQYLWLCALLDRMDVYFWAYAGVNALYLARTLLQIVLALGRFAPRAAPPGPSPGPGATA